MASPLWHEGHLREEILEKYAFGRLSDEETAAVEEHYLACTKCQDALETVEEEIRTVRSTLATTALHPPQTHIPLRDRIAYWFQETLGGSRSTWAAAAIAVTLAAGVAVYGWRSGSQPQVPASILLASYRGADPAQMAQAPAGRPLELRISSADIPNPEKCRAEVVNATGAVQWSGGLTGGNQQLLAKVPQALVAGQYWVRIYTFDNTLLREFGLRLN